MNSNNKAEKDSTKKKRETEILKIIDRINKSDENKYYSILNLLEIATESEIKDSYSYLVKKIHPDRCKAPKAAEAFRKVQKGYSVLSDPVRRKEFDNRRINRGIFTEEQFNYFTTHDINRPNIFRVHRNFRDTYNFHDVLYEEIFNTLRRNSRSNTRVYNNNQNDQTALKLVAFLLILIVGFIFS